MHNGQPTLPGERRYRHSAKPTVPTAAATTGMGISMRTTPVNLIAKRLLIAKLPKPIAKMHFAIRIMPTDISPVRVRNLQRKSFPTVCLSCMLNQSLCSAADGAYYDTLYADHLQDKADIAKMAAARNGGS